MLSSLNVTVSYFWTVLGHFATIPTMVPVLRWTIIFGLVILSTIVCTKPSATPSTIPTPTATLTQMPTHTPMPSFQPTASPTRTSAPTPTSTLISTPTTTPAPAATPSPTSKPTVAPTLPQSQSQQVVFEGATFDVELAVTQEERRHGLDG